MPSSQLIPPWMRNNGRRLAQNATSKSISNPVRGVRCWALKWLMVLLAGYYLGGLHTSYYYASQLHRQQQQTEPLRQPEMDPGVKQTVVSVVENRLVLPPKPADEAMPIPSSSSSPSSSLICQRLATSGGGGGGEGATIPTALELWFRHFKEIHQASQLSTNDVEYKFHDFTAELLQMLSPRLPRSTTALPTHTTPQVQNILHKLERRLAYLQDPQAFDNAPTPPPPPPPIQIVVMGGSVLVGRNCRKLVKDLDLSMILPNRECTWSFRLQLFLDQLTNILVLRKPLQMGKSNKKGQPLTRPELLFQVFKIAIGGTNTAVGSQILKYDLLPDGLQYPDIIINAYATNDMHVLTVLEMQQSGKTLREGVFDMIQEFVRAVMKPPDYSENTAACPNQQHPHPPLLIHFDDYLGNEQHEILQTMELSQSVSSLAQYYGFAAISYPNVVRDMVYGDTHEYWFSPEGWWQSFQFRAGRVITQQQKQMQREIHPGMGMHIVTPWIVTYNLLHMATTYCALEPHLPRGDGGGEQPNDPEDYASSWAAPKIPLRKNVKQAPGRPRPVPRGLPPPLTKELLLDDVSEQWRRRHQQQQQEQEDSRKNTNPQQAHCANDTSHRKCLFSWVSGLSLQQNNKTWIREQFQTRTVSGKPWDLVDEGDKIGFLPTSDVSATPWVLDFVVPVPVSTLALFYLKSYGPKWKGSRLQISMSNATGPSPTTKEHDDDDKVATTQVLLLPSQPVEGFHSKNTSEMYTQEWTFAPTQGRLRVTCELKGGSTFKIMGLAICR